MTKILFASLLVALVSIPSPAATTELLFVVMGGRTSCGSGDVPAYSVGLYSRYRTLHQKLREAYPDLKVKYVISCLHGSPPPDAQMEFVTSLEPNRNRTGNAKVLKAEIEKMANENTETFLIGHSYGGWLSMYLADKLELKKRIALLASVDPISNECGPSGVIFGSSVCHEAPRNLNNRNIIASVDTWLNFFQNQDSWITSGPIAEAENHHITYNGPHSNVDTDVRTWREIERIVDETMVN